MTCQAWLSVLAVAAAASSQMGCAGLLNGARNTQPIRLTTSPAGAIAASGDLRCETPCDLQLPRKLDAVVELSREGVEPVAVAFRSRVAGATLGNFLFGVPGIVLGLPADLLSGTGYELVPRHAHVSLEPGVPGVVPVAFGVG